MKRIILIVGALILSFTLGYWTHVFVDFAEGVKGDHAALYDLKKDSTAGAFLNTTLNKALKAGDTGAADKICREYKLKTLINDVLVDSTIYLTTFFQLDTTGLIYCDSLSLQSKALHLRVRQSQPAAKLISQSKRLAKNYFTKTIVKTEKSTQIGFFMTLKKGVFVEYYRFQFFTGKTDYKINNAPALTDQFMTLKNWVMLDSLDDLADE